ncbi:hypothetical protein Hanom_Chr10g00875961 [Helianthus anomalus]
MNPHQEIKKVESFLSLPLSFSLYTCVCVFFLPSLSLNNTHQRYNQTHIKIHIIWNKIIKLNNKISIKIQENKNPQRFINIMKWVVGKILKGVC